MKYEKKLYIQDDIDLLTKIQYMVLFVMEAIQEVHELRLANIKFMYF